MDYIKVLLPAAGHEGAPIESVFVKVDPETKAAHDSDKTGGTYTGILDNDSSMYPGLKAGTIIPFTLCGDLKPLVPYNWLFEHYGKPANTYFQPYYRETPTYKILEEILQNAGIDIVYKEIPADSIKGEIWARSNYDLIEMPEDPNALPDPETACLFLGHEAGHILSGLDSSDIPSESIKNEAVCDLIGYYLYELALRTTEKKKRETSGAN